MGWKKIPKEERWNESSVRGLIVLILTGLGVWFTGSWWCLVCLIFLFQIEIKK